jgi:RNA recognition motif. (a.k.a. RRM, RBD, or RNP domain)
MAEAPVQDGAGTTAKERRLAKRAAARDGTIPEAPAAAVAPASEATAAASEAAEAGMTAKERRLARRAAAREGSTNPAPAAAAAPAKPTKQASIAERPVITERPASSGPLIVFVGQLSFKTTAQQLLEHFRNKGGVVGPLTVRLLTHEGTTRSKGMAFVETTDPATLYQCLALHHTRLDGRILNVEKSLGVSIDDYRHCTPCKRSSYSRYTSAAMSSWLSLTCSADTFSSITSERFILSSHRLLASFAHHQGKGEKRKQKLEELRIGQKETMKEVVARIMGEFIAKGVLKEGELDADAVRVLEKFEGKVCAHVHTLLGCMMLTAYFATATYLSGAMMHSHCVSTSVLAWCSYWLQ